MAFDRILIVDDERIVRRALSTWLRKRNYQVGAAESLQDARDSLQQLAYDLIFLDERLPDGEGSEFLREIAQMPDAPMVVIMTGFGNADAAIQCMRSGAFDYLIKPFPNEQVDVVVKKAEDYRRVRQLTRFYSGADEQQQDSLLIGQSGGMKQVKDLIRRVAPTQATVLIHGESGTGKELIAKEIHRNSDRRDQPFIRVNCAAISETLIESEFFGHEKGAFTGADRRHAGRFELADGGTILLDEISEVSPALQAKLLRVLQEQEFERVGGTSTIHVDVRVIATTNRTLEKAVERGEFRQDLYYRLNVFPIYNPPLRERRDDIPLIARYFIELARRQHGVEVTGLSPEALQALLNHGWPGNVRELRNLIERAVIMTSGGGAIQPAALGLGSIAESEAAPDASHGNGAGPTVRSFASLAPENLPPLEEVEREHILTTLSAYQGNRTRAAERLGISLRTMRNKLRQYRDAGIPIPQ